MAAVTWNQASVLPLHPLPDSMRTKPSAHTHLKLPSRFSHRPLTQIPGELRHSLSSMQWSPRGLRMKPSRQLQTNEPSTLRHAPFLQIPCRVSHSFTSETKTTRTSCSGGFFTNARILCRTGVCFASIDLRTMLFQAVQTKGSRVGTHRGRGRARC